MDSVRSERVITYIDGFNLYFGLRESGYRRYYWLDMVALSRKLLRPNQELQVAKYFTARIAGPKPQDAPAKKAALQAKRKRQTVFLDALSNRPMLRIIEGHYLAKDAECRKCHHRWTQPEEKMTDVNIATNLIIDAVDDAFDTAIIVSGDSDLTPPIQTIRSRLPDKRIVVAFPPKRHSTQLQKAATAYFTIARTKLAGSQLPQTVVLSNGHRVTRPTKWK